MKKIIMMIALFSFIVSCNERNNISNTKDANINSTIIEPYSDLFVSCVGYIEVNYGPLLEVSERTLISFPDGKKDYFITFKKMDSTTASISFRFVDIVNNLPMDLSTNPGYFICNQENDKCFNCELVKPTNQEPRYGCYCSLEQGPGAGNGACSLIICPGPNPNGGFIENYFNIGENTISNLIVASLSFYSF